MQGHSLLIERAFETNLARPLLHVVICTEQSWPEFERSGENGDGLRSWSARDLRLRGSKESVRSGMFLVLSPDIGLYLRYDSSFQNHYD